MKVTFLISSPLNGYTVQKFWSDLVNPVQINIIREFDQCCIYMYAFNYCIYGLFLFTSPGRERPGEGQRSACQRLRGELAEAAACGGVWRRCHDPRCQEETSCTTTAGSRWRDGFSTAGSKMVTLVSIASMRGRGKLRFVSVSICVSGNESSLALTQLPPQCGYSVQTTWRDLSLMARYDACHVTQEVQDSNQYINLSHFITHISSSQLTFATLSWRGPSCLRCSCRVELCHVLYLAQHFFLFYPWTERKIVYFICHLLFFFNPWWP